MMPHDMMPRHYMIMITIDYDYDHEYDYDIWSDMIWYGMIW